MIDNANNSETRIEEATWADIQPNITATPNEKYAIYVKTDRINGHAFNTLHRLNTTTLEKLQLTPSTDRFSYSNEGVWIDNETYITLVDTVEMENYYNGNNYLVSININTGEIKRLIEDDSVDDFTSP